MSEGTAKEWSTRPTIEQMKDISSLYEFVASSDFDFTQIKKEMEECFANQKITEEDIAEFKECAVYFLVGWSVMHDSGYL